MDSMHVHMRFSVDPIIRILNEKPKRDFGAKWCQILTFDLSVWGQICKFKKKRFYGLVPRVKLLHCANLMEVNPLDRVNIPISWASTLSGTSAVVLCLFYSSSPRIAVPRALAWKWWSFDVVKVLDHYLIDDGQGYVWTMKAWCSQFDIRPKQKK